MMIEVTKVNRQVYYQGYQVSLPATYAERKFYRTITDGAFWLIEPDTGEIVFSFPLPMIALHVRGRYVASDAIAGVEVTHPTKQWERKHATYEAQFAERQTSQPDVLAHQ